MFRGDRSIASEALPTISRYIFLRFAFSCGIWRGRNPHPAQEAFSSSFSNRMDPRHLTVLWQVFANSCMWQPGQAHVAQLDLSMVLFALTQASFVLRPARSVVSGQRGCTDDSGPRITFRNSSRRMGCSRPRIAQAEKHHLSLASGTADLGVAALLIL